MGEHGTVGPARQHGHQHSGVGPCSGQHWWCIPGPEGGLGGPRESIAPLSWEFSQLRAAPCKRAEPYLVKLDYLDLDSNSVEKGYGNAYRKGHPHSFLHRCPKLLGCQSLGRYWPHREVPRATVALVYTYASTTIAHVAATHKKLQSQETSPVSRVQVGHSSAQGDQAYLVSFLGLRKAPCCFPHRTGVAPIKIPAILHFMVDPEIMWKLLLWVEHLPFYSWCPKIEVLSKGAQSPWTLVWLSPEIKWEETSVTRLF